MNNGKGRSKLFGLNGREASYNFVATLFDDDQTNCGIPFINWPQLFKIFNEALTEEEVELIKLGYGFGCKRLSQKEIAARYPDRYPSESDVSDAAHVAISKLSARKYKSRIAKLRVPIEQLFRSYAQAEDYRRELAKARTEKTHLRDECENAEQACEAQTRRADVLATELRATKDELAGRIADVEFLSRMITDMQANADEVCAECDQLRTECGELRIERDQLAVQLQRSESDIKLLAAAAKNSYAAFMETIQGANAENPEPPQDEALPLPQTLRDLELSEPALAAFERVKIFTIGDLCSMSHRQLKTKGVRKAYIIEANAQLLVYGLSIR